MDAVWPSSLSSSPSWDPQPPPTTPVFSQTQGAGRGWRHTLPAAGPCRAQVPSPQTLTSLRRPAPPRLPFYRCPYRVRGLCGFSSEQLLRPAPCAGWAALSPGRPGLCSIAPTAGSLLPHPAVIASDHKPQRPKTAQELLSPGSCGPGIQVWPLPLCKRHRAGRRLTGHLGQDGVGVAGPRPSWLEGLPQLSHLGPATGGRPGLAARWTGGGPHEVGRGPEPAQRSSPPSPCHCPISLG